MARIHSDTVLLRAMRRGYGGCIGIHYWTITAIVVGASVDQIFSGIAAHRARPSG